MRLMVKTGSTNEYSEGCDFALLDLTTELAQLIMRRKTTFDGLRAADPNLDELVYNSYAMEYFDDEHAFLEESEASGLMNQDHGFIEVAADLTITAERSSTECDKMVIDHFGVTFRCYPKHCDWLVTTHEIPYATIEKAARVEVAA